MKTQHLIIVSLAFALAACTQASQSASSPAPEIKTAPFLKKDIMTPQLIQIKSQLSFKDTVSKLREGISNRPLKLFAEIDHAAGAASADLALPPSTLFIFGNPKGGTPLMTGNPQMGIVLPLKMHVYQDGESVFINYPDIASIAGSYGLEAKNQPVPNITAMLKGLAEESSN